MMTVIKKLNNPPIKEAIFTITFKNPVTIDKINTFTEREYIKNTFPIKQNEFLVELAGKGDFKNEQTHELSTKRSIEGYTLKCEGSCNRLVQVRVTQLSYHNFDKYVGWETMFAELQTLWKEFCTATGGAELSQLSVRYLNHIKLPFPLPKSLNNYVRILPTIPQGINPALRNFFLQLTIPNTDNDLLGIITETLIEPPSNEAKNFTLLIDLTVSSTGVFQCSDSNMWAVFEKIRAYKNTLFFNSITDETEEFFQ